MPAFLFLGFTVVKGIRAREWWEWIWWRRVRGRRRHGGGWGAGQRGWSQSLSGGTQDSFSFSGGNWATVLMSQWKTGLIHSFLSSCQLFAGFLFFGQTACSLNLWTSRVTPKTHYIPLFICSFFYSKASWRRTWVWGVARGRRWRGRGWIRLGESPNIL